jgi:ATP-dependent protease ClpP protease subunit
MTSNSFMLIHGLSSGFIGKYSDMKTQQTNIDRYMNKLNELYTSETTTTKENLEVLLQHDNDFDLNECIKHGLVSGPPPFQSKL